MRDGLRLPGWCCAWVLLGIVARAAPVIAAVPAAMHEDARLSDIYAVDERTVWAVGDRGTIWHSADGGRNWRLQDSTVECALQSVFFLDSKNGWAVGGATQPYTHATSGVVLRTRDGGQHWQADSRLLLPSLVYVRFVSATHGWAIGEPSALFSSSIFTTDDGGRSWAALPAGDDATWTAADFVDGQTGALSGAGGKLSYVRRKAAEPAKTANLGLRGVHRLKLDSGRGWLVGDGGLVLATPDLGVSWQSPAGELPNSLRQFDLQALAMRGAHCWMAGSPGTRVFHSPDGGKSWQAQETGQTTPLRGLAFADPRRGFAAGDLGVILSTSDGGQTWQRCRGAHSRAAVLNVFADVQDVPLESVARLGGDEGYLTAVEIVARGQVESDRSALSSTELRLDQASSMCGASAASIAWRFPLRQPGVQQTAREFLIGWDRANDGHGYDRLIEHLVGRIRQWRPEVVITSSPSSTKTDALDQLISQSVLQAVEYAGDSTRYPHQVTDAGLQAWQVRKVYAALPAGELGTLEITSAQIATRLGGSLADICAAPRGLLQAELEPARSSSAFRLLVDRSAQATGQQDFFTGIVLSPGGEARRMLPEVADAQLGDLRRGVQAKRNLQSILARVDERSGAAERFSAELSDVTRAMNDDQAAEVLHQLALRYYRRGQWELAAQNFSMLAERYPKHPSAAVALIWLIQYHASGEAEWRNRKAQGVTAEQVMATVDANDQSRSARGSTAAEVRRRTALVSDVRDKQDPSAAAAVYARQLEQLQPSLFARPDVRFPLAVGQRSRGYPREAERFFMTFRRTRAHDAWWSCAQSEQWLIDGEGMPPKQICKCGKAVGKPRLDGKLDEPFWKMARPVELRSAAGDDAEWPAVAMTTYDEQFLYFAATCCKTQPADDGTDSSKRTRDADLSHDDRIELLVDIDRDYTTYYRLVVNGRGCIGDRCWDDASWNPDWFVATSQSETSWSVEAAIPLSELTGKLPESKHVWAVGVQRVAPDVGFQSWTQPAGTQIAPEGFGLLLFE